MRKYHTGLVLSGGAARGFVHLGVMKALDEAGIKPDIISAVSAGAIAGAFYADGYVPEEILEIYNVKSMRDLVRIHVPKTGFFNADGLRNTLKKNLRAKTIEQLKIPMVIGVTNLLTGKPEYKRSGNLVDIIMASSCVPVLFEVVHIDDVPYIDGGVMNNLPVEPIGNQCKRLIGVYIIPSGEIENLKGIVHVAERAFYLTISSKITGKEYLFDTYIAPQEVTRYGFFDTRRAKEMFELGYDHAREQLRAKN